MKLKLTALVLAAALALSGCGQPRTIVTRTADGTQMIKEYPTYGLFNEKSSRSQYVCYEMSVGNVVWSIILVETIVMPVYFVGFSLYNPVRAKTSLDDDCSTIDGGVVK